MTQFPSVEIIILNWNAGTILPDCLNYLLAQNYPNFWVTMVDNQSTDGSVEMIRANYPQVELICNEANLGFSAGNNVALQRSDASFVVLLNPDVFVKDESWLTKLIRPFLDNPDIGIAGCKLFYEDGQTLQHLGGYIEKPLGLPRHYGRRDNYHFEKLTDVPYVLGGAMALRRAALAEIGFFDENFFLYYEDVDVCLRMKKVQYRVVVVPEATAIHLESVTTQKESASYLRYFHKSRWQFLLKHFDLDTLLNETMPAEEAWLNKKRLKLNEALADVYHSLLLDWLSICEAALGKGSRMVELSKLRQIGMNLIELRQLVLRRDVAKNGSEERPLLAKLPFIGPRMVTTSNQKRLEKDRLLLEHQLELAEKELRQTL